MIWLERRKSGDFTGMAERFSITPMLARMIINRDISGEAEMETFLHGGTLHDPHLMKDMDKATEILAEKIHSARKIRIIGDYDIDGVSATYILLKGISRCGGIADMAIPDRERDGYGINSHLIDQAAEEGVDTILTCDNGISASEAIRHGKDLGMTMIVTDHHDIPFTEGAEGRQEVLPEADAVVNPKQRSCPYPYKGLCGAVVAWKLIQVLYERMGIPVKEADEFYENAAFATIGDVMDLTGENRTIVRTGLKALRQTKNPGMRALILQSGLSEKDLTVYHVGFVLGPCINASGRLDTAERSLRLLLAEGEGEAAGIASELIALNESRKDLTRRNVEKAEEIVEKENLLSKRVLSIYLPDCHESLAGIIAGRLRERYHRPTFVMTKGGDCIKGSGRSIEEYSMYEELTKASDLLLKFGGHPMAAGFSLEEKNREAFMDRLESVCTLTAEDLQEKIRFDMVLPFAYISERLVEEIALLEPFGKSNPKPLFAASKVRVLEKSVVGKNRNVLRMTLSEGAKTFPAVCFSDPEERLHRLQEKGEEEISILYYPNINEYRGNRFVQLVVEDLR